MIMEALSRLFLSPKSKKEKISTSSSPSMRSSLVPRHYYLCDIKRRLGSSPSSSSSDERRVLAFYQLLVLDRHFTKEDEEILLLQLDRHHQADPSLIYSTLSDGGVRRSWLHVVGDLQSGSILFKVKWLVSHGLSLNDTRDSDGMNLLDYQLSLLCVSYDNDKQPILNLIEELLQLGADIHLENPVNKTSSIEYAHREDLRGALDLMAPYVRQKRRRIGDIPSNLSVAYKRIEMESTADITLVVSSKHFKAHRNILKERSTKFKAMFESTMREATENIIQLETDDPISFGILLDSMYAEHIALESVQEVDAIAVLHLLNEYGVMLDVGELVDAIAQGLDVNNVLDVLEDAKALDCDPLVDVCRDFIINHHHEIVQIVDGSIDKVKEVVECLKLARPYQLVRKVA